MSRLSTFCFVLALLFARLPAESADENKTLPVIEVLSAENWDRLVPRGKEVDAIYGDYVLKNQWLTAVIAQPLETRNANMTVRSVGGCLIDLTANHFQSDQLSAWYPGRRKQAFRNPLVEASAQSSSAPDGTIHQDGKVSLTMEASGTDTLPACKITWSLGSSDRALQLTTVWTNHTSGDLSVVVEDDVRADGGKEEMFKSDNGTHGLFTIHDSYWQQAYGWRSRDGLQIRVNGNARESTLVYESDSQKSVTLKPGETLTRTRELFVARDLPELRAVVALANEPQNAAAYLDPNLSADQWGPVLQIQNGVATSVSAGVLTFRKGDVELGTRRLDQHPDAHLPFAPGQYEVSLSVAGQTFGKQGLTIPELPAAELSKSTLTLTFPDFQPGDVAIRILDEAGVGLPAKVEFLGAGDLRIRTLRRRPASSSLLISPILPMDRLMFRSRPVLTTSSSAMGRNSMQSTPTSGLSPEKPRNSGLF